ncbi:MAG: cupin domain-containing protein [Candidatus Thorarchaeota archaeon]
MPKEKEKEVKNYRYTRVYTDENGETHFEDVAIELLPTIFAPPAPALNLSNLSEATRYGFVNAPSDWFGNWHPTPKRQVFIYLSGEMEAKVSDGEVRSFGSGSVTLVEDTTGKGHLSRVIGDEDVLAVVIQLED